eukprot:4490898-Pyramimonas_sp.AAC.1
MGRAQHVRARGREGRAVEEEAVGQLADARVAALEEEWAPVATGRLDFAIDGMAESKAKGRRADGGPWVTSGFLQARGRSSSTSSR